MKEEKSYPIISLCKDDLRELYRDVRTDKVPAKIQRKINALSDANMRWIHTSVGLCARRADPRGGIPRRSQALGKAGTGHVRGSARRAGAGNGIPAV